MVIDTLLGLIEAQRGEALVIPTSQVPYLVVKGERKPLSMPPLGADVAALILADISTAEERKTFEQLGRLETTYDFGGQIYTVVIERHGEGLQFRFQTAANSSTSPPPRGPTAPPPLPARSEERPRPPRDPSTHGGGPTALWNVLALAMEQNASDVFLSAGRRPILRVADRLVPLELPPSDEAELEAAFEPWLDDAAHARLAADGSVDLGLPAAHETGQARWRAHLFRQHHGLGVALRPIRRTPPTLQELALPDELYDLVRLRHGLVLMAGTTGSGKSTTLVALIERLNRTEARHVVTLEDPIEYEYSPDRALIHQRELGRHVPSFAEGLRAALRESPDVILVGEMRDRDTIAAALTAAETGHLVLSTIHSGSAVMALERIIDAFPEHQHGQIRMQLASSLRAVVTQRLLPRRQPPLRVPAFELLRITTAVAAKLREGRIHQIQTEIQTGRTSGMTSFEARLAELVRQGLITEATAREAATDRALLEQHLRSGG